MIDPILILNSHLSRAKLKLTPAQYRAVEESMTDYAILSVDRYRANEAKAINKEALGLIPSLVKGQVRLYIRNWYFKKAKKAAQVLANIQNRKVYVIRSSDVNYTLLSNKDVELNKRLKVLGKNVGAKELTETSDFVAYPKKY